MKIKMSTSILDFYYMASDLDNEGQRDVIMEEFKEELTKALNLTGEKKEIEWVKQTN